jgi:hypothetical protein
MTCGLCLVRNEILKKEKPAENPQAFKAMTIHPVMTGSPSR